MAEESAKSGRAPGRDPEPRRPAIINDQSVERLPPSHEKSSTRLPDSYFRMLQVERWAITLRRRRVNYLEAREFSEEDEQVLARFERPRRPAGWVRRWLRRLLRLSPLDPHGK